MPASSASRNHDGVEHPTRCPPPVAAERVVRLAIDRPVAATVGLRARGDLHHAFEVTPLFFAAQSHRDRFGRQQHPWPPTPQPTNRPAHSTPHRTASTELTLRSQRQPLFKWSSYGTWLCSRFNALRFGGQRRTVDAGTNSCLAAINAGDRAVGRSPFRQHVTVACPMAQKTRPRRMRRIAAEGKSTRNAKS